MQILCQKQKDKVCKTKKRSNVNHICLVKKYKKILSRKIKIKKIF